MTTLVTPTNLQKMEFNVTTAEGPSRVTIVTGTMPIGLGTIAPNQNLMSGSFKALLDPTLAPGQFRKATSIVSFASMNRLDNAPAPVGSGWVIEDAQATFDDEAGRVQLSVDVTVNASGSSSVQVNSVMFQVTTLSKI